ncbi:hypothetical protein B0T25DRAFT_613732 [Lasiosphaeria hispida]|uniref:Carbohydrate kinase PfkB domain-containing protein n=1 Tax=Lasiosphaeria hispida TaxID=260671 RepID=A0AAJ0HCB9_9PEZI|nr:hypothetical protein B0T25DRAFT_613732 [Lasiosphaeria hispida]
MNSSNLKPIMVWEPNPTFCNPGQLQAHQDACKAVDVFSTRWTDLDGLVNGRWHPRKMPGEGDGFGTMWLPAFYGAGSDEVVDPTGAGSAFLGAMAWSMATGKNVARAAVAASIVASFVVEQVGAPGNWPLPNDSEMWNGKEIEEEAEAYHKKFLAWKGPYLD